MTPYTFEIARVGDVVKLAENDENGEGYWIDGVAGSIVEVVDKTDTFIFIKHANPEDKYTNSSIPICEIENAIEGLVSPRKIKKIKIAAKYRL